MPKAAAADQLEFELVRFAAEDQPQDFELDLRSETIWATSADMAALFKTPVATIVKHIEAVLAEGELNAETTVRSVRTASEGDAAAAAAERYNLDMILSVGYRANSKKATAFRQWASRTLRALMVDGFVLDQRRLRSDRETRDTLAARLRAIRAEETNIYESVRAFFAASADDYAADSDASKRFTTMLEDKFAYAVTGETPPDLILERADHDKPAMGLQRFDGAVPSMDEARIAQNYLDQHELFIVHTLCEQFLLLVQQHAARGHRMTMAELSRALDDLLRLNDYPVLTRHKDFHAARAIRHAQAEYARYILKAKNRPKAALT
ncbi:RhuM family protein [Lichenihabitans psoromatis]|uniref:RhuM family protein n=1 Tax=Lichenihabitans psoromatis TaxID=2528642 RepID=UPI00103850C6|nr:RhuM family protein [Lichenihabitans psoromatis]